MREFITGNQAVVRGAVAAGCDFFAGYPITPASSILSEMIGRALVERGRERRLQAIQTEDEIAAIGLCVGAAMAGARAMTATSGPGLSLYSETIGLAQMGEVPLVIVDCQRMGPATGGATATGDGDVMFARHVTAGGFPLPVYAAADAESAYRLTIKAFNVAETLRTPVILLSSKDIALTRQTVDLERVAVEPRRSRPLAAGGDGDFRPYECATAADVPAFLPIGGERRVRFTGSIHDACGLLTIDRSQIARKLEHLREKISARSAELADVAADVDETAGVLVISYGLADGAAREAVARLRTAGVATSRLTLYGLWPVPSAAIRRAAGPAVKRVVVPELNIGLYVDEIRGVLAGRRVESLQRFDGGLISPERIVRFVLDGGVAKEGVAR